MNIELTSLSRVPLPQQGMRSHSAAGRVRPSLLQYDYMVLRSLSDAIDRLIETVPRPVARQRALDIGSDLCPYQDALEARGYAVETLDLAGSAADHAGTVESTGLPDKSFDLVLCTQVLEHCLDPFRAIQEIHRILKPGGRLLASAPHVWFYHPHPTDHWRFTQQGMAQICERGGLTLRQLLAQGGSVLAAAQIMNFLAFGVLGRAGAPLYLASNLVAPLLDRVLSNDLFCLNFALLAERC